MRYPVAIAKNTLLRIKRKEHAIRGMQHPASCDAFKKLIGDFYRHYRRKLPWRTNVTPYNVVVSEVMLQQTQVTRVLQKFDSFISVFPDFESLANASLRDIMSVWQGMGYNRRALALQRIAGKTVYEYNGILPADPDILVTFPGIGHATASSIACFAFNLPAVFIETNIRSVFCHFFFAGGSGVHDAQIVPLIKETVDAKNPREWYYALMDYGAFLKSRLPNPSRQSLHYRTQSKFEGSLRQVRGAILRALTVKNASKRLLREQIPCRDAQLKTALSGLHKEGLVTRTRHLYSLP